VLGKPIFELGKPIFEQLFLLNKHLFKLLLVLVQLGPQVIMLRGQLFGLGQ
jgi:hypothetical protein